MHKTRHNPIAQGLAVAALAGGLLGSIILAVHGIAFGFGKAPALATYGVPALTAADLARAEDSSPKRPMLTVVHGTATSPLQGALAFSTGTPIASVN